MEPVKNFVDPIQFQKGTVYILALFNRFSFLLNLFHFTDLLCVPETHTDTHFGWWTASWQREDEEHRCWCSGELKWVLKFGHGVAVIKVGSEVVNWCGVS